MTILSLSPLSTPWPTLDPFLFCVHHADHYPAGDEHMRPRASLEGRSIGADFSRLNGWSMYHGRSTPGFPQHPHRGFETITIVKTGFIDHSDSLGATARIGPGDVQWMTAGKGIVHSEMFPLLNQEGPNQTEFFQLWLNLPARDKLTDASFTMFWNEEVPHFSITDTNGRKTDGRVIAGDFFDQSPPPPPPRSWASDPTSELGILTIRMDAGASMTLPPAANTTRVLYFYSGNRLQLNGQQADSGCAIQIRSDLEVELRNGDTDSQLLLLQGTGIKEPVVQHGPFVMNSREEIIQAIREYQRTQFGHWPWASSDPTHPRSETRFAQYPDGSIQRRPKA